MTDKEEINEYINDEFIIEPAEEDENDEDIFDQINKQTADIKEIARTRGESDKRQKFDSAEYEIKKQKAKQDAKQEARQELHK